GVLSATSTFFFFMSRPGASRDLHSFPTRRSSDLCTGGNRRGAHPGRRRSPASTRREGLRGPWSRGIPTKRQPSQRRAARGRRRRDRKSTRLNSSHVEISYAVFCLKKKNVNVLQEC